MESIHDVDVSWMKHCQKDHNARPNVKRNTSAEKTPPRQNGEVQQANQTDHTDKDLAQSPRDELPRLELAKSTSSEKTPSINGGSKPASPAASPSLRRGSWLSSLSSKFSSSQGAHHSSPPLTPPLANTPMITSDDTFEKRPAGPASPKNAVLPHGFKAEGDGPYVPAPPKVAQPSFLTSALRRLSSSSSSGHTAAPQAHTHTTPGPQHGLCERKIFNVDHNRERCCIPELNQNKLRRVAFCVDVEITSTPRYDDEEESKPQKKDRKRMTEKGEGDAFKKSKTDEKEFDGNETSTNGLGIREVEKEPLETTKEVKDDSPPEKETSKKKEKKKRNEEERKARKEKKRKLAEVNGTVPVEMVRDSSETLNTTGKNTLKAQASPTIDPARIYRRCCQLRGTPILKKITEQLTIPPVEGTQPGLVSKLDLSKYWLQLPDLITLGDYLAVVPVKELLLENCGLTDEGVRVILAGLLAAKLPVQGRRKGTRKDGEVFQGGVIERLVLKNNTKIGRDGWRYICLFIHMCRSLKSLDLSQVPFPEALEPTSPPTHQFYSKSIPPTPAKKRDDVACLLSEVLAARLAGPELELFNMAECGLSTDQLGSLIDGAIKSGLRRLGIAGNHITPEGMEHIARYVKEGKCEGLDIGGNDLKDLLGVIANALDASNDLLALSLADCNLNSDSLWALFPALVKLKNFKFIDLSQNHDLFDANPHALGLLRRYLPKLSMLKRIHLSDVAMKSDQAIALAEILPESPSIAHVNLLENPQIAKLADAKDESSQEEACALYASLMAAVRVSQTIICVDVEVPSSDSSEVVKALAKQVVAYCLWNMERGPVAEISEAAASISEPHSIEKDVVVPEVILHLVGHVEGVKENHNDDEPAPDEDYVIGGTGVVKALGICLRNKGNESRPPYGRSFSTGGSGAVTPRTPVNHNKAKDMSKNLLASARKIRARLQPALVKESKAGDSHNYYRLLFLDNTLSGMIKRFEDEFPETRLESTIISPPIPDIKTNNIEEPSLGVEAGPTDTEAILETAPSDDESEIRPPVLSRHNSDVSIASKAQTREEGRMHRFGSRIRRDIFAHEVEDDDAVSNGSANGKNGSVEPKSQEVKMLRAMLDEMKGDEVRAQIESRGEEAVIEDLRNEASVLRQKLKEQDPEAWERFMESQQKAKRNSRVVGDNTACNGGS